MKHTPGPWIAKPNWSKDCLEVTTEDREKHYVSEICEIEVDYTGPVGEEQKANLALILAAPELLAACEQFVDWCKKPDLYITPDIIDAVHEAVAKAKTIPQPLPHET